jgi:hypothetical protein
MPSQNIWPMRTEVVLSEYEKDCSVLKDEFGVTTLRTGLPPLITFACSVRRKHIGTGCGGVVVVDLVHYLSISSTKYVSH